MAAREAKTAATGKKPGGKPPQPPVEGPLPTDQVNLTDEESRIMPVAGGGFEQCYNAQAVVAAGSLLVVAGRCGAGAQRQAAGRADAGEDRRAARANLGKVETSAGGHRLFQRGQRERLRSGGDRSADRDGPAARIIRRLRERFAADAAGAGEPDAGRGDGASAEDATTGKALYALRKQTPEPVFGIIKSVMGFRQFSLRGLEKVRGEWSLVTMAWNMKRMFVLAPA